ncbi:MAG: outer membrane protein assembly factor BamA [Pseudomonadota bacterium]
MNSANKNRKVTGIKLEKLRSREVGKLEISAFRFFPTSAFRLFCAAAVCRIGTPILTIICLLLLSSLQTVSADSSPESLPCFSKDRGGLIKDIRVHGAFPLFERDIVSAMTLYIGTSLDPAGISIGLSEQKSRIESYLKEQGFTDPSVSVQAFPEASGTHYVVQVNMDKGHYQHLQNIRFIGAGALATNQAFSALRLKTRMTTWKKALLPGVSGRLIHTDIQKDLQNITAFYRSRGYLDVGIDYKIVPYPEHPYLADLEISISEGAQYRFEWEGNAAFSAATMKSDLAFWDDGKINDISIKRSIRKIKDRYQKAGYMEPQVHIRERPGPADEPALEKVFGISIAEGVKTRIDRIRIAGNNALPTAEIEKQILSQPGGIFQPGVLVRETLNEDIQSIAALYFSKGFRTAEITPDISLTPDQTRADIQINVHEGTQTIVSGITITGLHAISNEAAFDALSLKTGSSFFEDMLENDKNKLTELISETGHPHIQVQAQVSFPENTFQARIEFRMDEGPYVVMGDVIVSGNFTTRERILKNEMEIKTGDPFSLKKLLKSQKNIRNMEIIRSVQFQPCGLKEKADRVNLIIAVEEAKPYILEAGIGYEAEKGAFAHTRLEDRNLLGANIKAWAETEISQIGYKGETGLTEPRLMESRISADALVYAENRSEFNQSFGVRILGSSLAFSRKWENKISAGIAFNAEQRQLYENNALFSQSYQTNYLTANGFAPRSLMMITPKLQYDTRDSFVRPRKGIFAAGYVDVSRGIDSDLDHFLRYRLDTRYYITPLNRLTFACSARWGYIEPMNTDRIIANDQLFYLGGSTNVRGFDENMLRYNTNNEPVGGLTSASGTVEARIDLGNQIELCIFTDSGSLGQYQSSIAPNGFRTSAGLGLRYLTPIGPIGLVYGFKLDPEPGEAPGRFHISIGYTF